MVFIILKFAARPAKIRCAGKGKRLRRKKVFVAQPFVKLLGFLETYIAKHLSELWPGCKNYPGIANCRCRYFLFGSYAFAA